MRLAQRVINGAENGKFPSTGSFPFSCPKSAKLTLEQAELPPRLKRSVLNSYCEIGTAARELTDSGKLRFRDAFDSLGLCRPTFSKHLAILESLGLVERDGRTLQVVDFAESNTSRESRRAWEQARRNQKNAAARARYAPKNVNNVYKNGLQVPENRTIGPLIHKGDEPPSPRRLGADVFFKENLFSKHERRQAAEVPPPLADEAILAVEMELLGEAVPTEAEPTAEDPMQRLQMLSDRADEIDDEEDSEEAHPTSLQVTQAAHDEEHSSTQAAPSRLTKGQFEQLKRRFPEMAAAKARPFLRAQFSLAHLVASAEGVRAKRGPKMNPAGLWYKGCKQRQTQAWSTPAHFSQAHL